MYVPNSFPAKSPTAVRRSTPVTDRAATIVALVPMCSRLKFPQRSFRRRTNMATSAPCRPRYMCSSSSTRNWRPDVVLSTKADSCGRKSIISSIMKLVRRMCGRSCWIRFFVSSSSWPVYLSNRTGMGCLVRLAQRCERLPLRVHQRVHRVNDDRPDFPVLGIATEYCVEDRDEVREAFARTSPAGHDVRLLLGGATDCVALMLVELDRRPRRCTEYI